jgi:hypothetical protein
MRVAVVLADVGMVEIVEATAFELAARERKASRVDDMHNHPEAGAKPQQSAGILRDIGLVEGEVDRHAVFLFGEAGRSQWV